MSVLASEALAPVARRVALSIGERLIEELAGEDRFDVNAERYPSRRMNGSSGFGLLYLALARLTGESRFEAAMHAQLARAARADGDEHGLFTGFASLRAVASLATAIEPRYARLVAKCDEVLDARPGDGDADLIGGSAGIAIARTIGMYRTPDREWRELRSALSRADARVCYGLAHGLPGVVLAWTMTAPSLNEDDRALIGACVSRIKNGARSLHGAPAWARFSDDPVDEPMRSVWCYGTPGIALALLQVARSTGDGESEAYATDALMNLARVPRHDLCLTEHGLCHGTMGNALVYYGAARLSGDARLLEIAYAYAREAADAMLRDGMRTMTRGRDGVLYDALGHLNGVAGIALGLLTVSGAIGDEWTKIHGVALT